MPDIKLPDGSIRQYKKPVTVADIASDIGEGLFRSMHCLQCCGNFIEAKISENSEVTVWAEVERFRGYKTFNCTFACTCS